MSRLISFVKAEGTLETEHFGKIYYSMDLRPNSELSQDDMSMLYEDIQDFERYLLEKYNIKDSNLDKFSIWKKLKLAIKNLK